MTEEAHILTHIEDGILVATFNRPSKLNAMSHELMSGLRDAVEHFREASALKVMLIRATGRYFSSGADLRSGGPARTPPQTGSGIREFHRRLPSGMRQLWDEIEHIEKPFVVAHQGACVGGGLEMSMSCDFRLAAVSASYAFPEARFGVLPATNGVSRLTRLVGPHWARLLIMANMPVSAHEALNMGLVHKVYADETFEEDVMAFCRHLALQNSEVMGTAKIAIELAHDLAVDQAAAVERMANASLMLMPSYQEGLKKHVESLGKK
ncbi:enoyl-CoA hydratase/isomerase family protein [Novosphingobium malaysiense]|uniref:Enoyl-CoA hydratase n=1 Tax=Novosphingobium malaysiense TaxID=1348853 RepID=A0A0B1ZI41_9SPHN|nr:enoyl-CoA hydratase/isomerase family protein [Novosphingobium malaysiense]KHK88958.1 enoyl-CoA hydratase [Novosphingobium malaysiense]